jgi:hypothetical protein
MDYIFGRLFGRILRSNNYRLSLYLRMHSLSSLPWVFGLLVGKALFAMY